MEATILMRVSLLTRRYEDIRKKKKGLLKKELKSNTCK